MPDQIVQGVLVKTNISTPINSNKLFFYTLCISIYLWTPKPDMFGTHLQWNFDEPPFKSNQLYKLDFLMVNNFYVIFGQPFPTKWICF